MTTTEVRPATAKPATELELDATLPGSSYTDPAVFAAEQERIFARQWMYVGRSDDLVARGDYLRRDVAGRSIFVVRTRSGVAAYHNVCRHRGSQLCLEDTGNVGKAIRCPYHAWAYKLDDGGLITTPNFEAMSGIDKQRFGLARIGVEEWCGLVWVNLAGGDRDSLLAQVNGQLNFRLGSDLARFERYDVGRLKVGATITYDCPANWKVIFENFQECYHCGTIHPELVEQIPVFGGFDRPDGYDTDGFRFAEGRHGFSVTGQATLPRLPGLRDEDDERYFGMVLRPNAFLSLVPDHVIVHRFEPVAVDRTLVSCDWLFDPDVLASGTYDISSHVRLFDLVNQQDLDACARCQPNMADPLYAGGGVLVPDERSIIADWFYPWYRRAMEEVA